MLSARLFAASLAALLASCDGPSPACAPGACNEANGGGVCDDGSGAVVCTCNDGYDGARCDACAAGFLARDGACVPATCGADTCNEGNGGGSCDDGGGEVVCECSEGYVGASCRSCAAGFHAVRAAVCERDTRAACAALPSGPTGEVQAPVLRATLPASWDESWLASPAVADLDGDGDLEIVAARHSVLYAWSADGAMLWRAAWGHSASDPDDHGSTRMWASPVVGDFDGDGDLDWFVSSIWDPDFTCVLAPCTWGSSGNRLYRNAGGRAIEDATDFAGVRESGWGWGAALFDYDNDGDLDLVATNGIEFPGSVYDNPYNEDPTAFWENVGAGRMRRRARDVGIDDTDRGKGLVVFDYDGDGDLDVFVVNNGQLPRLYRNDGGSDASFLRVRPVGTRSTSEALGARVWVRVVEGGPRQVREIGSVTHFLGQSERVAHFGLGRGVERVAEVEIRWPTGRATRLEDVDANQTLVLVEP